MFIVNYTIEQGWLCFFSSIRVQDVVTGCRRRTSLTNVFVLFTLCSYKLVFKHITLKHLDLATYPVITRKRKKRQKRSQLPDCVFLSLVHSFLLWQFSARHFFSNPLRGFCSHLLLYLLRLVSPSLLDILVSLFDFELCRVKLVYSLPLRFYFVFIFDGWFSFVLD